ncbi:MAG: hypothetical protein H6R17_4085 [Proteobacteria bacterium]|nr:hypothetical protein [Pseudomonadota bacterium]
MNSGRARRLSGRENTVPDAAGSELSWLGRWRWNVLAALFAALLLVALTLRRWRRGEVSDVIDVSRQRLGIRVALAIVFVSSVLTGVLALFPLASDQANAAPMVSEAEAVAYPVREAGSDPKCAQCGVVESTRELARIAETSAKGVELTVRMKDGASHLFIAASSESSASWRAGERVIFIDGRNLAGE